MIKRVSNLRVAVLVACLVPAIVATEVTASGINSQTRYLPLDQGAVTGGLMLEQQIDSVTGAEHVRNTLMLDRQFDQYTLHLGSADSSHQRLNQFGLTIANTKLSGFNGEGDTRSTLDHRFNAVGDFHFHGGINQRYQYHGFQLEQALGQQYVLHFGRAVIESPALLDREVTEIGWHTGRFNLSLLQVNSGRQYAGRAVNAGFTVADVDVGMQYMEAVNSASFAKLSFNRQTRTGKKWGLEVTKWRNRLFDQGNETRVLATLEFALGRQSARFYATEPEEGTEEKRKRPSGTVTGVALVGAGLAISSGGSGGDDRPRFASQNGSAFDVLNGINPISVTGNREWGGYVYRNADGSFSSTRPIQGQEAMVSLPAPQAAVPGGAIATASYHTHAGANPLFDNENFSPQDILSDIIFRIDGYLGTPAGRFKYHNVRSGRIITLGGPGTLATGQ